MIDYCYFVAVGRKGERYSDTYNPGPDHRNRAFKLYFTCDLVNHGILHQFHCDFLLAAGQSSDSKLPA